MNAVLFHITTLAEAGWDRELLRRTGRRAEDIAFMAARIRTPSGRDFHVSYHPSIGPDGQRDGISLGNDPADAGTPVECIWLEDRSADDMFCSELFAELTGRYPYEVEAEIPPDRDYLAWPSEPGLYLRPGECEGGCVEADDRFACECCGRPM